MNCEQSREKIMAYLEGSLTNAEASEVVAHIGGCPNCREVMEETRALLTHMKTVAEEAPAANAGERFFGMLNEEKKKLKGKQRFMITGKTILRYAAAVALLLVGFLWGRVPGDRTHEDEKLAGLTEEVKKMKQLVMVSMLKEESASDRILAVGYSEDFSEPSDQMIETLVHTLDYDESPNVRMAAAKALEKFSTNEKVRLALVNAFKYQTNPLVQVTLIDIMVDLHEQRAIIKLRDLTKDQQVDPTVRKQAEIGSSLLL